MFFAGGWEEADRQLAWWSWQYVGQRVSGSRLIWDGSMGLKWTVVGARSGEGRSSRVYAEWSQQPQPWGMLMRVGLGGKETCRSEEESFLGKDVKTHGTCWEKR